MKKMSWIWLLVMMVFVLDGCEPNLSGRELPLQKGTSMDNGCAKMCVLVDGCNGAKEKRYIKVEKLSVYFSNTKEQSFTTIKVGDRISYCGGLFSDINAYYQWAEIIVPADTNDKAEWEKWINENHLQRPEPQLVPQRVLPPKPLSPEKEEIIKEE